MSDLGPCFTAPQIDADVCLHAPAHRLAWMARDDTARWGRVLCQVCMACDTIVSIADWKPAQAAGEAPTKAKRRRKDSA